MQGILAFAFTGLFVSANLRTRHDLPAATSHILTSPSQPPETRRLEALLKLTQKTKLVWPLSIFVVNPFDRLCQIIKSLIYRGRETYSIDGPYSNAGVVRCRGKKDAVGRPRNVRQASRVPSKIADKFTCVWRPDFDNLVCGFLVRTGVWAARSGQKRSKRTNHKKREECRLG